MSETFHQISPLTREGLTATCTTEPRRFVCTTCESNTAAIRVTTALFEVVDPGRLAPYPGMNDEFADAVCSLATAHMLAIDLMFLGSSMEEDDFLSLAEAEAEARDWSRLCRLVGRDDIADILLKDLGKELLTCPHCSGSGLVTVAPFTDIECEDCRGEGYR